MSALKTGDEIIVDATGEQYIITKVEKCYVCAIGLDGRVAYIANGDYSNTGKNYKEIEKAIEAIKSKKEKEEYKRGEWKKISLENDFVLVEWECSRCRLHRTTLAGEKPWEKFCPQCGADMRENKEGK